VRDRSPVAASEAGPRTEVSSREAAIAVTVIAVFSVVLRIFIVRSVHAPTVFSDELGYEKLAQSIGTTGHLALFGKAGLSYPPLYPALLSPIFALGASAPTAYTVIKIVNALLISLAIFPTYKIARFVLSRRLSVLVAALTAAAPLMAYSSYSMSENLAYPVCLFAIWATLEAIRSPSVRSDAVMLGTIALASAARTQLVVLFPAALTAVLLAAVAGKRGRVATRLAAGVKEHVLMFATVGAALLIAGLSALGGAGVLSIFGRYAVVGRVGLPNGWHTLNELVQHLAGLDMAVGFVPFAGTVVAAIAFARGGFRSRIVPFAAVAISFTTWLLVEVAYDAARFDGQGDVPRIHERFLIYVVPFFLIALFATLSRFAPLRIYVVAGAAAALLPLTIPFHTDINRTTTVDTFGMQPFEFPGSRGFIGPATYAALAAVVVASILALILIVVRRSEPGLVFLVLVPFIIVSGLLLARISNGSVIGRAFLPARADWVDAAKPHGGVAVIAWRGSVAASRETAYNNRSIKRLYYLCSPMAEREFGEQKLTLDLTGSARVNAAYAVVPSRLEVVGRVVARNRPGREELVALSNGQLRVANPARARRC
jgi:hypothetical protein